MKINWTLTGKILVLFDVALSLMFAFWAYGVNRNRIDFQAENKARADEIDRFKKVLAPAGDNPLLGAEGRWQFAVRNLKAAEERRPALVKWYAEQLEALRTGQGKVQALVQNKAGKLQVDPANGQPILGPVLDAGGKEIPGLASLSKLGQNYSKAQSDLQDTLQQINKAVADVRRLTDEISGLRSVLAAWQEELRRSQDQHEYLQPLLYNRQVEVQILTKRHKALESRLQELKAVAVAKQP
jgi:hypothetical protein